MGACKVCVRAATAAHHKANPAYMQTYLKGYVERNRDRLRAHQRASYAANREARYAASRAWVAANPEKARAHKRAWKKRNPQVERAYVVRREARDPAFLLRRRIGRRIYVAMRRRVLSPPSQKLFGCTHEELVAYIEAQFKPGMTWENYGEWEVDHKKPISRFDLSDPVQLEAACHFSNLQPLWRKENRKKGAKYA